MKIDPIETLRLLLRGFTKDDARFAIGIWNDRQMGAYLPDAAMDEIDGAYLAQIEALGEDETCCYLIAEDRRTHGRIGTCSFIPDAEHASIDIAYCVHRDFWGSGYATEMAQGMLDRARTHGASRATVRVNRENAASNAVAKKLGFSVIGEKSYKKRGTALTFTDNLYEKEL